ncbi:MAG TPA: CoA transferase [Acidimicrobiales bacterium]|nr:CoA transferase [Acidimicrobiales bacterium]
MVALLESRRILDLTDIRGAMCARMLADLGADVIRLDRPDPAADRDPVAHAYRNANKRFRSMPETAEELHELISRADVLVENLAPGERAALGLDPAATEARHPHLVHVVLADFGLTGPRAGWRLEPLVAQAAGGTLFASGFRELAPCWFPGYLGPDTAAVHGFIGAIAALADRRRHGRGQTVEVSVQEATLAGTNPWSVAMNDYLKINPFLPAEGKRNADGFYFVLPAADGWVRFVIGNDKQWMGAMHLGRDPEVLMEPEWLDQMYRRMNADVARLVMSDALRDRTRTQLFEEARLLGATMGVIHMPSEYVAHEQVRTRAVFSESRLPGLEGGPLVRPPLRFSATPGRRDMAPPEPAEPWGDRPTEASSGESGLLLAGTRVVEFGMAAVGPEASLVLSELGADVIKIESSAHLDVLRLAGFDRINCAFAFNVECRGRRSVTLNLDTEKGRELAFALCAAADVVIENYRGGVLENMGLGYEAVKGANPSVVYASSQGYGRGGPLGEMAAYGPLNLGFVGLHHLWNHPDSPYPCGTSLNHPDHVAGKFLGGAIIAALEHRRLAGEGQLIDMAQTEFAAYLRGEVYLEAWRLGADPVAIGNDSNTVSPHGVYPAAGEDRWVAIVVTDDQQWAELVALAGWPDDPATATNDGRLENRAAVNERLAAWTAGQDPAELAGRLQAKGISAAPVMGPLDHLADDHMMARGAIVELQHPEVGSERHIGNPIRMSVTEQRVAPSAPCLGADTVEVLGQVLGLAPEEVDQLIASGVCT